MSKQYKEYGHVSVCDAPHFKDLYIQFSFSKLTTFTPLFIMDRLGH